MSLCGFIVSIVNRAVSARFVWMGRCCLRLKSMMIRHMTEEEAGYLVRHSIVLLEQFTPKIC